MPFNDYCKYKCNLKTKVPTLICSGPLPIFNRIERQLQLQIYICTVYSSLRMIGVFVLHNNDSNWPKRTKNKSKMTQNGLNLNLRMLWYENSKWPKMVINDPKMAQKERKWTKFESSDVTIWHITVMSSFYIWIAFTHKASVKFRGFKFASPGCRAINLELKFTEQTNLQMKPWTLPCVNSTQTQLLFTFERNDYLP